MKFIDNVFAPEVFASAFAGLSRDGQNMRLTFAAHRANHDPEVPAGAQQAFVVVSRVVMPRESVALMIASLTAALEASEPQGSAPPQPPPH